MFSLVIAVLLTAFAAFMLWVRGELTRVPGLGFTWEWGFLTSPDPLLRGLAIFQVVSQMLFLAGLLLYALYNRAKLP